MVDGPEVAARVARNATFDDRLWRRHIRSLVIVYSLWTLFWGMIAVRDLRLDAAFQSLLPPVCAVLGLVAVGVCLAVRRRLAGYLRANAAPLR